MESKILLSLIVDFGSYCGCGPFCVKELLDSSFVGFVTTKERT